ncbi:MAG TPA: hypothetical protein EYH34_12450 [Planctomycetes bacterium]|nr:hypothetical protein [Planctomycetota bacterium]
MPIRFHCTRCRRLLSIGSRKAGAEVTCPKCGAIQRVPSPEVAAAAGDAATGAVPSASEQPVEEADQPKDVSASIPVWTPPATVTGIPPTSSETASVERSALEVGARGMILFPRRVIYWQGLLFVLVAVAGFVFGYWFGRSSDSAVATPPADVSAAGPVLLEGRLVYDPGGGRPVGDEGAVVIAIPDGVGLRARLPTRGIRPLDARLSDTDATAAKIRACGGAITRADASGRFSLILGRPGDYRILAISAHAERPSGEPIEELDRKEIAECFDDPEHLVGPFKYRWEVVAVAPGTPMWEADFGASGRR